MLYASALYVFNRLICIFRVTYFQDLRLYTWSCAFYGVITIKMLTHNGHTPL